MGQLGPFGSGSFGIHIDQSTIEANARRNFGVDFLFENISEYEVGDTPMAYSD